MALKAVSGMGAFPWFGRSVLLSAAHWSLSWR